MYLVALRARSVSLKPLGNALLSEKVPATDAGQLVVPSYRRIRCNQVNFGVCTATGTETETETETDGYTLANAH
jgi:hypothetical protein